MEPEVGSQCWSINSIDLRAIGGASGEPVNPARLTAGHASAGFIFACPMDGVIVRDSRSHGGGGLHGSGFIRGPKVAADLEEGGGSFGKNDGVS